MNPPSPTRRQITKTAILILTVCCCTGCVGAAKYSFTPQRFSSIALVTAPGKSAIKVETSTKEENSERIIFESQLAPAPRPAGAVAAYATPAGTLLTLTQLPTPVVNDANRGINSGDWKLTITGQGAEFNRLKAEMPKAAFGDKKPLVYLGTKDQ